MLASVVRAHTTCARAPAPIEVLLEEVSALPVVSGAEARFSRGLADYLLSVGLTSPSVPQHRWPHEPVRSSVQQVCVIQQYAFECRSTAGSPKLRDAVLQDQFTCSRETAGKPLQEFVDGGSAFEIRKECRNRNTCFPKHPCAADLSEFRSTAGQAVQSSIGRSTSIITELEPDTDAPYPPAPAFSIECSDTRQFCGSCGEFAQLKLEVWT